MSSILYNGGHNSHVCPGEYCACLILLGWQPSLKNKIKTKHERQSEGSKEIKVKLLRKHVFLFVGMDFWFWLARTKKKSMLFYFLLNCPRQVRFKSMIMKETLLQYIHNIA